MEGQEPLHFFEVALFIDYFAEIFQGMKLYVRTAVLLSIALLFASCAERQNGGKQATAKIGRLAVSLINGDKYVFGQNIDLQCDAESGAVIDSLSVSFGGRTMKFAQTAKLNLPTNQASVGQHTIRITAWTADGSQAEGRAHVRIVSDVEPERYTYKIIKQLQDAKKRLSGQIVMSPLSKAHPFHLYMNN